MHMQGAVLQRPYRCSKWYALPLYTSPISCTASCTSCGERSVYPMSTRSRNVTACDKKRTMPETPLLLHIGWHYGSQCCWWTPHWQSSELDQGRRWYSGKEAPHTWAGGIAGICGKDATDIILVAACRVKPSRVFTHPDLKRHAVTLIRTAKSGT